MSFYFVASDVTLKGMARIVWSLWELDGGEGDGENGGTGTTASQVWVVT